jgi:hypothetical protein
MTTIELQSIAASFSLVTPDSLSLWHWTDPARKKIIMGRIGTTAGFADFSEGACGRGFYTSLSAIDLIDRGNEVLDAGTCDGCLFSFGMNLAVMLRTSNRTWMDPEEDLVMLIKDYILRHPEDIPMLAPDKPAQ